MTLELPAPGRLGLALPGLIMVVLFGLSSIPADPEALAGDPRFQFTLWVPAGIQNALHIPVYASLALAWLWALHGWMQRGPGLQWLAVVIAIGYGALDELHQGFVPGRQLSLMDATLNALGVVLALIVWRRWTAVAPTTDS